MAKNKTIKIDIGHAELGDILYEWTGKRPTPAQAIRLLAQIQEAAQERLDHEAFSIVTELVDRL